MACFTEARAAGLPDASVLLTSTPRAYMNSPFARAFYNGLSCATDSDMSATDDSLHVVCESFRHVARTEIFAAEKG